MAVKITKQQALQAIYTGNFNTVNTMLLNGLDIKSNVNATDHWGVTPIMFAAYANDIKLIQLLLSAGARVDMVDNDQRNLVFRTGNTEVLDLLIKAGSDVNYQDIDGDTPLHNAVLFFSFNTVKFLIENGADINIANNSDQTPIHYAAETGKIAKIRYLIKLGANIYNTDCLGLSALDNLEGRHPNKYRRYAEELKELAELIRLCRINLEDSRLNILTGYDFNI